MTGLPVAIVLIALFGMIASAVVLITQIRRDKQRAAQESAVAKAAYDYLARYKIRSRVLAATLADNSMALMVETPPHKKLRFSYIIEQPIKNFIQMHTGVQVAKIFWRFPLRPKSNQTPEVHYADASTIQKELASERPRQVDVTTTVEDSEDEYFQRQSYDIEEVSWEDFSTLSGGEVPDELAEPQKKWFEHDLASANKR
jgi:type II secretory pathway pseudopilin PulG